MRLLGILPSVHTANDSRIGCVEVIFMSTARFQTPLKIILRNILQRRILPFFILFCLFSVLLSSCRSRPTVSALEVLEAMLATSPVPAGDLYVLPDTPSFTLAQNREDGNAAKIHTASPDLLSSSLGSSKISHADQGISAFLDSVVDDGAMRFSTGSAPCEYAVFRCISRSDTEAVVELLLERKEALRRQFRDSEGAQQVESAQVVVIGKYVIFSLADNAGPAVDAAKDAILKS